MVYPFAVARKMSQVLRNLANYSKGSLYVENVEAIKNFENYRTFKHLSE